MNTYIYFAVFSLPGITYIIVGLFLDVKDTTTDRFWRARSCDPVRLLMYKGKTLRKWFRPSMIVLGILYLVCEIYYFIYLW